MSAALEGESTSPVPEATAGSIELRVTWVSDLSHELVDPVLELADGVCAYLAAVSRAGTALTVRRLLASHLVEPVSSANHLRLVLMRSMREVEPRPHCLGAALTRGTHALVAVTPGASAALVRDGRILERTVDAATFSLLPGDRLVLVCARLDPLLQDGDELARIVSADDPHSSALTLVEVGHLRGGTELSAVVSEVGLPEDTLSPSEPAAAIPMALDDLLAALAPTFDGMKRTPTPVPRGRRWVREVSSPPRSAPEAAVTPPSVVPAEPPTPSEVVEAAPVEASPSAGEDAPSNVARTPEPPPPVATPVPVLGPARNTDDGEASVVSGSLAPSWRAGSVEAPAPTHRSRGPVVLVVLAVAVVAGLTAFFAGVFA